VRIDRAPVDLVDAERTCLIGRNRDRRRDHHIHVPEQLHESIPELSASMHRVDVLDPAIRSAARDHVVVVAIGAPQYGLLAAEDRSRLLGVGDRLDRALEHFRIDAGIVGYQGRA